MKEKHIEAKQRLDNILENCQKQIMSVKHTKLVRKGIMGYQKEIILNRMILGDVKTLEWLETSMKVSLMLFKYEKGKNI